MTAHPACSPYDESKRLYQVARQLRRRGVQAVAAGLVEALQGADLADLERLVQPPVTAGKPSAKLPGGITVFGLPGITAEGGRITLQVEP